MWDRSDAPVLGETECLFERLWWISGLGSSDPEPDHPTVSVFHRIPSGLHRDVEIEVPRRVRGQPHLHTEASLCFERAVAEAAEHLVPRCAAAHSLRWREDALYVDRSVRGSFLCVAENDLPEVPLRPD